jgi:hypothetical protein
MMIRGSIEDSGEALFEWGNVRSDEADRGGERSVFFLEKYEKNSSVEGYIPNPLGVFFNLIRLHISHCTSCWLTLQKN